MARHQITLLGCGKMGGALVRGWLADECLNADFTIIEPQQAHLGWLDTFPEVKIYSDCDAAHLAGVRVSSMVVLAVKPQIMEDAISGLHDICNSDTIFLTIAAGISTSWLKARIGSGINVLRAMPNTPASIGRGVTVLYSDNAQADQVELATQLLRAVGQVVAIEDEGLMDAVTAVSGSGPAYVFLLAEAITEAGVSVGLPARIAKQLAEATVTGAAALIEATDDSPSTLREDVTSKGGTTAAALAVLMDENGLAHLMHRAIKAAKQRSIELGA